MDETSPPRTVQSVEVALEIVDVLQRREGAGVTQLAEELGRSKGTIHTQLTTLRRNEYVIKRGDTYHLSLRFLDLGEFVKRRLSFYDVVRQEVDNLAAECGELAQFATEEHGRAVYLYKSEGEKAVQTASRVGMREYLHCLSLGKAMLAHMPEERVDEILDRHGMKKYTERTIASRGELFDELAAIRERGYAIDNGEKISGLRCIAAPVLSNDGSMIGAVSVTAPASRVQGERLERTLPDQVTRSANVIEINAQFS